MTMARTNKSGETRGVEQREHTYYKTKGSGKTPLQDGAAVLVLHFIIQMIRVEGLGVTRERTNALDRSVLPSRL